MFSSKNATLSEDVTTQGKEDDVEKGIPEHDNNGVWDPSKFPDGGLNAWLVIAGAFCFLFCSLGWINCIGVFQKHYQTNYLATYNPSAISWIASLELFILFAGGIVVGRMFDIFGPHWLFAFGTVMHVFGLMMLSVSTEYYQIMLSQGVCSPIGITCLFTPAISSASTWFLKRRGLAIAVVTAGSSIGGVIFPIMFEQLLPKVGFRWTIRILAFLILTMLVFANLVTKARTPPNPVVLTFRTYFNPLREVPYAVTTIAAILFFLGLFVPFNFLESQALELGMSQKLVGYLIPILNATSLFGRIIPGYIGDHVGPFNTVSVMCLLSGILTFALWLPAKEIALVIAYTALYGFLSGAFISLVPALIAKISDIKEIGARLGMELAILSVPALVSNPIAGALVSYNNGNYSDAQVWSGTVMILGGMVFVLARLTVSGVRLRVIV